MVFDAPILLYYAANEGKGRVHLVGTPFRKEDYGIVFQAGNPLRKQVNNTLLTLREDGPNQQILRQVVCRQVSCRRACTRRTALHRRVAVQVVDCVCFKWWGARHARPVAKIFYDHTGDIVAAGPQRLRRARRYSAFPETSCCRSSR